MSPVKIRRPLTAQNAVIGLEKIFDDLQTRFHDQWDWMEAYFYLGAIEAALDLPIRDRAPRHRDDAIVAARSVQAGKESK